MTQWFTKERFELEQTMFRPSGEQELLDSIYKFGKERHAYTKNIMGGLEYVLNHGSQELLFNLAGEKHEGAVILQLPRKIELERNPDGSRNYIEISTGSDKQYICVELRKDKENKLYIARPQKVCDVVHLHIALDGEVNRNKNSKEFSKWSAEQLLKFGHMKLFTEVESGRKLPDVYAMVSGEYLSRAFDRAVELMIEQRIVLGGTKIEPQKRGLMRTPVFFGLEQDYSSKGFVNKVTRYLPETLR